MVLVKDAPVLAEESHGPRCIQKAGIRASNKTRTKHALVRRNAIFGAVRKRRSSLSSKLVTWKSVR